MMGLSAWCVMGLSTCDRDAQGMMATKVVCAVAGAAAAAAAAAG